MEHCTANEHYIKDILKNGNADHIMLSRQIESVDVSVVHSDYNIGENTSKRKIL